MTYINNILYLVGPNGTGKTRALKTLSNQQTGIYISRHRPYQHGGIEYNETASNEIISNFKGYSEYNIEQLAMSLLRERSNLRFKIFAILSKKLGRDFYVEIIERSQNFKVTSGLNENFYEGVKIPRYDFVGESSGLKELLILLTIIHSELSDKYFIDEPEISLHPEAQRFLKNEIIKLAKEKQVKFWLATHSPIFFAPESIEELSQAIFFSTPHIAEGNKPDFTKLSSGQIVHLEKSLLRLDTEKWLLVHSKAVIFCEGFRDKAIFKKILEKVNIDLSEKDFSIVETGGKDDFSTLFLLCSAITKPCYFIGDLDNLIESKLIDKYNDNGLVNKEISSYATSIQDYISEKIRKPLGDIIDEILKLDEEKLKLDKQSVIKNNLNRIRLKSVNSKSLALEIIIKHDKYLKSLFTEKSIQAKISLVKSASENAINLLLKVGFFIHTTGSLETYYESNPFSPDDDKEKIRLFDAEWEAVKVNTKEQIEHRYKSVIDFIKSITKETFDSKKFVSNEVRKYLAKISVILLEDKPFNHEMLALNTKYQALKISDLLVLKELTWNDVNYELYGESVNGFLPKFKLKISSLSGINSPETIEFVGE
ncbi:ATP-dependent nuclease [Adhaeribacter pallidiroseus]|uniref:Uncharacterized protein n=1 Tax=Adhaeribacter pallidiroseus TaxID=2072847 RepID=A0A369QP77_9BACT|nr:TOPRIM nucleotidyl transferase/hydrolase domain-containing protein [Adhaeribacter pallidiroseus]RDC66190.1 hypothetical protein AHMF7616_04821 [Adhaeribacter pallidiroseus]